jgi:hypothetical protein
LNGYCCFLLFKSSAGVMHLKIPPLDAPTAAAPSHRASKYSSPDPSI